MPKSGQKTPSPRDVGTEVPVGKVAVPKTVQKPPSSREDATETSVGKVAVPKSGRGPFRGRFERDCWIVRHVGMPLEYLWAEWPWRRDDR